MGKPETSLEAMAPRPCSLCLAYAFLLCTGLFGGHLFYVERYAQVGSACRAACLNTCAHDVVTVACDVLRRPGRRVDEQLGRLWRRTAV